MKITRLDFDGVGSPAGIATRIHMLERDLPIPVPIEALCKQLDIVGIETLTTEGFEAALITDALKASGAILVAEGRPRKRRRFSIAHELGHFLIPAHLPADGQILCTSADLRRSDQKSAEPRRRMEAEANRFASLLLMPPHLIREGLRRADRPDLAEVLALAERFDVSKEAMARAYVDAHREAAAVLVVRNGRLLRAYPNKAWSWRLAVGWEQSLPDGSTCLDRRGVSGGLPDPNACDPDLWLHDRDAAGIEAMTEQVLVQRDGFALALLHAQPADEDERWAEKTAAWRPRF